MKKSISLIISAYKADRFIEECLDSINKQTYFKDFNDYEILLGFDGCDITRDKVLSIRNKYKNLRLFWFEENNGPYLVFNTLISNSKYDIICVFGADDIMRENHIESNINLLSDNIYVKSRCSDFNDPNINKITRTYNPDGLVFFNKKDFLKINGFENWRCGADTDLNKRLHLNGIGIKNNNISTSLRRKHHESLTNVKDYGMKSSYRNNISNIIRNRKESIITELKIYIDVKEI